MIPDANNAVSNPEGTDQPARDQHGDTDEQLSLEQLDARITEAEQLHRDLSARLDSIARD